MRVKIQRHSLLDAPGSSTIIFFPGCNMSCPYCHNVSLWRGEEEEDDLDILEVKQYIVSRIVTNPKNTSYKEVDWIVLSGGEPMLHPGIVERILDFSKNLGFKTCLYTNGTSEGSSEHIRHFVEDGFLDAVNLDYKWKMSDDRMTYSSYIEWARNLKTLLGGVSSGSVTHLRINTTLLKSYHTPDIMVDMKRTLVEMMKPDSPDIPIVRRRGSEWAAGITWSLETFFNDGGKIPTLGDLPPSETPSQFDVKQIILRMGS